MEITTHSEKETIGFGRHLAEVLSAGDVIFLSGELGSGKTQIVKGMAEALGIDPSIVQSPAYDLINEYEGGKLPLFHMDFYRLEHLSPEEYPWIAEYGSKGGIVAIEWASQVPEGIFREHLEIVFAPYESGDERKITLRATGKRYEEVINSL